MVSLGLALVGVIVVNGLFSYWQENRAEQALASLEKMLPKEAVALRSGKVGAIASDRLVPGDIVLRAEGDVVPADCRLIEAFALRVNNATVTGESLPKPRSALLRGLPGGGRAMAPHRRDPVRCRSAAHVHDPRVPRGNRAALL